MTVRSPYVPSVVAGPFNFDVGNPRVTLAGTDEENAADTEAVKKLATFLKERTIPSLVPNGYFLLW